MSDWFTTDRIDAEGIRQRWLDGNNYIKEHGFEVWFEKNKNVAHYIEQYETARKG